MKEKKSKRKEGRNNEGRLTIKLHNEQCIRLKKIEWHPQIDLLWPATIMPRRTTGRRKNLCNEWNNEKLITIINALNFKSYVTQNKI